MITRVDQLFLPGKQLALPFSVPGVEGPPDALAAEDDRINILVIGLDRRPKEADTGIYRADTMIVLTIHPGSKRAAMVSFPRDLWIQIPLPSGGVIETRMNETYEYGQILKQQGKYDGDGPTMVKQMLQHNFGIGIDNYAVLDFDGFIQLIDALGGINIYLPDRVAYWYSTNELGYDEYYYDVGPGYYYFTGEDALAYARYRNDSDLYRIQRQQRVIFAAVNKSLSVDMLSRAPQLWERYHGAVKTDISVFRVPGLAALVKGITTDAIVPYSIGDAVIGFSGYDGASLLRMLPDKGVGIIGSTFRPPAVARENAKVSLVSLTGNSTQLKQAEFYLQLQGIAAENLSRGSLPAGERPTKAEVIYGPRAEVTARFLARWLGGSLHQDFAAGSTVTVVLDADTRLAQVAFPGTDSGAAPASRYQGINTGQFNPFQPPPSTNEPNRPTPVVPTVTSRPAGTPVPSPSGSPTPTRTATPAPGATATPTAQPGSTGTPRPN
ncbi:MAG: hypothetical protein EXR43_04875 [Dehalococcoidia bacterium]|nr:hypothetical protein [Dehalococcoidia bacterium]